MSDVHAGGERAGGEPEEQPEEALRRYAGALADAVEDAIPRWVERVVREALGAQGLALDQDLETRLGQAAVAAQEAGVPQVRALLATDIDQQRTTPLTLLRGLVPYPTEVLRAAGARPVARDELDERMFPDDVYGLTPASFADVDTALHEPGMTWGAAKAFVHRARHRHDA
jgi:hypothetical protein